MPTFARLIVRALFPAAERREILDDLSAEFQARRDSAGRMAAHIWLWGQLGRSAPSLIRRGWWRGWSGFESAANQMRPGGAPLESLVLDTRFAVRRLSTRPLYASLAVLTLALGVGGGSAIYAVARAFLLEPLPFADEATLAVFGHVGNWSEEELVYLRGKVPGFSATAGMRTSDATFRRNGGPAELIQGEALTAEAFEVLGAHPVIGRTFATGEDQHGAAPVVVISYDFWQELGGQQSILGENLMFDGQPRTVVGVMPPGFWFPDPTTRMWNPAPLDPGNRVGNYALFGRLAPETTPASVTGSLARLSRILEERFTGDRWPRWLREPQTITPMREYFFGPLRPALVATLVAMGCILLIACANVSALMLGQVEGRTTELAVRSALGADRRRIAQQVLIESVVIGVCAAVVGAGIAAITFRVLVASLPLGALAARVALDFTVFGAALSLALVSAVLVATVPLIALSRGELRDAIAHSRTRGMGGGSRVVGALVAGEVALAMLMAAGAALLVQSVGRLYAIDPGVARHGVAIVDVVSPAGLSVDQRRQLFHRLTVEIGAIAGVSSASIVQRLPLRGSGWSAGLTIPDRPDIGRVATFVRITGPRYFQTMAIPLTRGRDFNSADTPDREPAVIVNAAFVTRYFGTTDPIGKQVGTGFAAMGRVVGVVGNVVEGDLTDSVQAVRYFSYDQIPFMVPVQTFVVRADHGDAAALLNPIRGVLTRIAPGVAVQEATTMSAVIDRAVGPARQVMCLLTMLAVLAVVLGAIGIYGVISQVVTRRRREWSIRIALGLSPAHVMRLVVGRGAMLVASGVVVGLFGMTLMAQLIAPFLYGIRADDPTSALTAVIVLFAVGVVAALIPALRAGRVDPAFVLREQ